MPEPEDSNVPETADELNPAPPVQTSQPQPQPAYQIGPSPKPAGNMVPGAAWWIILGAICLVEVVAGFILVKGAKSVPATLGISFVASAVLIAIFLAIAGRKAKIGWNIGSAPVILIAMYIGAVPGYVARSVEERSSRQQMSSSLADDLGQVVDGGNGNEGPKKLKPLDMSPKAKGQWGEIEVFVKKLTNDMIEVRNGYLTDLESLKWTTILDGARLAKDKNMAESRAMLKKAKETVANRRKQSLEVIRRSGEEVGKLDVSDTEKRDFVKGYRSGLQKAAQQASKTWDLESQTIDEFAAIIDLLDKKRGKWEISEGQVMFYEDADLNEFNRHMQRINDIVKEEEEMQKSSSAKMKEGLDILSR